jgi:beta-mannosidase
VTDPMALTAHDLGGVWALHLVARGEGTPGELEVVDLPATVPGCVHTDLLREGLIDDPDVGTAEDGQHWVGRSTWRYETSFDRSDVGTDHVDLVCEGLDTVASIHLNGVPIGETRNMHRSYRFPIASRLREGRNDLRIDFHPIGDEIDAVRDDVGELPCAYPPLYPYVRKMACNFGWDWGPKLTTVGIWKPIRLESWSRARLDGVRPLSTVTGDMGRLDVHVGVQAQEHSGLRIRVEAAGAMVEAEVIDHTAHVSVEVPDVARWWPVGLGPQPLYDVEVALLAEDTLVDVHHTRVGFRTTEIVETPDEVGSRWALVVNGVRVPVRGYNWIPDDVFPTEVDRARYGRRIDQAVAGNANLLRVWGGGLYEADAFYDLCDERGVLVWQDFAFACAAYPESPAYRAEVEAEARENVTRLVTHPSLVLWNGNNENVWGYHDWGWQEQLEGRPWGGTYYAEVLPRIVEELDGTRPYLIGSPSSGTLEADPNDDARGVQHLWDVWNDLDFLHYRDHAPSFVAEMGWCGPPTWATLRRGVPDGPLDPSNPVLVHHLRAADGLRKLQRGIEAHFPPVVDADDWLYLLQVIHGRSQAMGVEHLRAVERCSGAIIWQLNDCWPVISWSAIDADERPKPVWYALRRAFAPRLGTIQPSGRSLEVVFVNDERDSWAAQARVRRMRFDGALLAEGDIEVDCHPGSVTRVGLDPRLATPDNPGDEVVVLDRAGHRAVWFFAPDAKLAYPPARFDVDVHQGDGQTQVTITAHTLLRDLCLFPDRVLVDGAPPGPEVVADEALVTLLPGEAHTFRVSGLHRADPGVFGRRPVLRCLNDIAILAND